MIRPGTFKPLQMRNAVNSGGMKYYDLDNFHIALSLSDDRQSAHEYAAPFGFTAQDAAQPQGTFIRPEVAQTIDDCIGNLRPDLNYEIWKMIAQITREREQSFDTYKAGNVIISKISLELLRHSGLNVGAMILYFLIIRSNLTMIVRPTFNNAEGTEKLELSTRRRNKETELYVYQYIIDHDIGWTDQSLKIFGLPDTVLSHIEGKKLTELLTHPVFDQFDLTAQICTTRAGDQYLRATLLPENEEYLSLLTLAENELASLQPAS